MTLEVGGAEQGHQNRLGSGPLLGSILLGYLSDEDRRSHLLFCMVIIRAHPFKLQKGEQFIAMLFQAFEERVFSRLGLDTGKSGSDSAGGGSFCSR